MPAKTKAQKVAWTPLLRAIGSSAAQAGIGAGYATAGMGSALGDRWVDNHYLKDNGLYGPYIPYQDPKVIPPFAYNLPGHAPQVPSQMDFAERGHAPMTSSIRAAAEGMDASKTMLNTDFNSFLTGSPASARWMAPVFAGLNVLSGAPPVEAMKTTASTMAPGVAAGLAVKTLAPKLNPLSLAGTLRSGLGAGLALKGTEYAQRSMGLESPTDLVERMNEPAWRVGARAVTNMVASGAGGLIATKNPIGGVGGLVTGAMKEPEAIYKTYQQANAVADRQVDVNHVQRMKLIENPRYPLDKVDGLNDMPSDLRDSAIAQRRANALSGGFDAAMAPRSTWKSEDAPGLAPQDAPTKAPSFTVDQEINNTKLKSSPALDQLRRTLNLDPHLALGGGMLAGGLGIWGLRKLFGKKEDQDKVRRSGYASPAITSPDRWVPA